MLSSSSLRESGWWDFVVCVGSFNMHAHAFYFLCVRKANHTQWFQRVRTHRLCASCLIILITLPSSDALIPHPTNKHHSQINSQTSLKQHLPLTTSAHQLKGSHPRSIKIDSLLGRRVPASADFYHRWHWRERDAECPKVLGCLRLNKASLAFNQEFWDWLLWTSLQ